MMLLGLRNIAQAKENFMELLFYDIDRPIGEGDIERVDAICQRSRLSYLLFTTKHGAHFICLTPLIKTRWALLFDELQELFGSYYAGKTIRISRKKGETQTLLKMNTAYGEVIPNLFNLYATRFNYAKMEWIKETSKYLLHFEKYRSKNE